MAYKRNACDEKFFEGLSPQGKEFKLPNILNPWLSEVFAVNPHLQLKSYPIRTFDDSFLYKTLTKPSVPLVASVENFFFGRTDNPFSDFDIEPIIDGPMNNHVGRRFHSHRVYDTKIVALPAVTNSRSHGSVEFQNAQRNASTKKADLQLSSNPSETSPANGHPAAGAVQLRNLHVN